jgi:hypothetical protein
VKTSFLAFSALALGVCVGSSAQADTMRNFQVANWLVGAYSFDGTKTFSHCAASTTYHSGIVVLFAINRGYAWNMGFANPQWQLTKGQEYDIAFSVDGSPPIVAKAEAVSTNQVTVRLADSSELFSQFRRGHMLQVASAKQVFSFSLDGTSALLPTLLDCVRQQTTPVGASNPFAAQQATRAPSRPREAPSRDAMQAEAAIIGANVLGASGIKEFSFGSAEDAAKLKVDAIWTSDTLLGKIVIAEGLKLDDPNIPSTLIGEDAKRCKGAFLSGSLPESDGKAMLRIFTSCQAEKKSSTTYYLAVSRPKGGIYVFATISNGSQEEVKEADSGLRNAVFKVVR